MENSFPTPSPMIKGEDLPENDNMGLVPFSAESTPDVVDPLALLSSPNNQDDFSVADLASPSPEDHAETTDGKKPTKKRKSWGQVLPEPKTNLPPRSVLPTAAHSCLSQNWCTDIAAENEPRQRTRRNSAESSESSVTDAQPSRRGSARGKRPRLSPDETRSLRKL